MLVVNLCVVCFGRVVSYETQFSVHLRAQGSLVTRFTLCSALLFHLFSSLLSCSPFLTFFSLILVLSLLLLLSPLLHSHPPRCSSPLTSFLSLLISHPLRSPVYLISRLSKGGERASGEPSIFMLSQFNMASMRVCVHVWTLTISFCRYTRGHKHTQADTHRSQHT